MTHRTRDRRPLTLALLVLAAGTASPCSAQGRSAASSIEYVLEVHCDPQAPLGVAQQWLEALQRSGFDRVRITAARRDVEPAIVPEASQAGRPAAPQGGGLSPGRPAAGSPSSVPRTVRVTALVGRDGRLRVPGLTLARTDAHRLRPHLDRQVLAPIQQERRSSQLEQLRGVLSRPCDTQTRGEPYGEVVRRLIEQLGVPVSIDPLLESRIRDRDEPVGDELRGVSRGTALAFLLDQADLMLVPRDAASAEGLVVQAARSGPDRWPVGRPDSRPERQLVPKLLDFLPVQIHDAPLVDVVSALQSRLDIPVLWDRRGMARQEINPQKVSVDLPEGTSFYKKVLDQALFQARLRAQLRVDDAGRPFLWITPLGAAGR